MTEGGPSSKARPQRRIQSIDVGFRLIRVLERASGNLPLSVVAELADMPASKAHLYMVSFVHAGIVEQDLTTGRYGLGPYALQLGAAAMRQLDVVQIAREAMETLQVESGLQIFLSVWGNRGPVIISKVDSTVDVLISIRVGHVLPLHRAATGRVFLAYKPRAEIDHALQNEHPVDPALKLRAEESLPLIRRRKLAFSDSQLNAGFASICGPIFDYAGDIAATVTALGMKNEIDLDPLGKVAGLVRAAAESISSKLAYRETQSEGTDGGSSPPR
jgi:DNA-binding IclR family transcriptional regulator